MSVATQPDRLRKAIGRRAPRLAGVALGLLLVALGSLGIGLNRPGLRFDFLTQPAGFQIAESVIAVGAADPVWWTLVAGLLNTLRVSAAAIAVALPLGVALALGRGSGLRPLARITAAIVEPVRNTPLLLQLFLWYGVVTQALPGPRAALEILPGVLLCNRGLFLPWPGAGGLDWPQLAGFNIEGGLDVSPELTVLGFGLALFHGCYLSEVFRAGLRAVPPGQRDAARALSLPPFLTLRKVVLPQALGFALPAIAGQLLALVKNSSLAVAIGYPDFVAVLGTTVNRDGRALEGLALTVAVYLGLNAALGAAIEALGRRLRRGRPGDLVVAPAAPPSGGATGRPRPAEIAFAAAVLVLLGVLAPPIVRWVVVDAVWQGTPEQCAAARGACWAVVTEKSRLLAFGLYPTEELRRVLLADLLIVVFVVGIGCDRLRHLGACGLALLVTALGWLWLVGGGFGLARVATDAWGGLSLTLGLAVAVVTVAGVAAVPLALARRSSRRWLSAPARIVVEVFRSVPLVALLLCADLVIPALLPVGWSSAKLERAFVAITLLAAVGLAEILRGALASVAPGQTEAARALGLSARQALVLVTLPQAVRIALPAAVNAFVGAIKDTSLVTIVGILDVTGAARAAVADPAWRAFSPEIYLVLAALYFALCFPLARFARGLESPGTSASAASRRSTSAASL